MNTSAQSVINCTRKNECPHILAAIEAKQAQHMEDSELNHSWELIKSFIYHLAVSLAFLLALEVFDRALFYTSIQTKFKEYIQFAHEWLALTTYIVFSAAVTYKFINRMYKWVTR